MAINVALAKIKEGNYGVCQECGEQIGAGRLKVIPLADYCVECQSKIEKEIDLEGNSEEDFKNQTFPGATSAEEET